MKKTLILIAMLSSLIASSMSVLGMTDSERKCVRENVQKTGKAILRVEGTMSVEVAQGGEREQSEREIKTNVCVVSEDGYAIGLAYAFNPELYISNGNADFMLKTHITSLKYLFDDGSTLDVEVVLEDKRTGFAVLRPVKKSERKFDYVDLTHSALAEMLDEVYMVLNGGEQVKFQTVVDVGSIMSKVLRPQLFYVLDDISPLPAMPVFNVNGRLIGLFGYKFIRDEGTAVLLGAADVLELLKQSREGKPQRETSEDDQTLTRKERVERERAKREKNLSSEGKE